MMNSQAYEVRRNRTDNIGTVRLLTTTSLLISAVFVLCGCSQQSDGSVFKVQSGEKTLLDIKKNPDEKVSIEVDAPKINLKMKHDDDTVVQERTTVTQTTVDPTPVPVQAVPVTAPQPVPGVAGN